MFRVVASGLTGRPRLALCRRLHRSAIATAGQTLTEKIVQRHIVQEDGNGRGQQTVRSGDFVRIRPAHVMTHDNSAAVMEKFTQLGIKKMHNPRQVVFTLDHNVQDKSEKNLNKYRNIEAFAAQHQVDFYPAGRGIGHQVMCEELYAYPGTMVVASDSHSNMYGGIGCLGTPVVRTDAAAIWATGETWWQVPPICQVRLSGKLAPGVTGKDVIIALCGFFSNDEVLNHAVEFCGDGVRELSIDDRLTIANMTTEWGALSGLFPADDATRAWIEFRRQKLLKRGPSGVPSDTDEQSGRPFRLSDARLRALSESPVEADQGCTFAKQIELDLASVSPYVSGPNSVKTMASVRDLERQRVRVDKAYLVSCVNSRASDIEAAAQIVANRRVAEHVDFYVAAASSEVEAESVEAGYWQTLIDAGAKPLPPGCGPCIGLGKGLLEDGEVGISATNRNFKGRMGSPDAKAYLASPAVVAASAINGYISSPSSLDDRSVESIDEPAIVATITVGSSGRVFTDALSQDELSLLESFPTQIAGVMVLALDDNINTDGIYPGKYTYREDMDPSDQAKVIMENYDPNFAAIAPKQSVLVTGYNFGTGSSREQAATALKHAGVQLILAGSVNETYKRNALNNGLLVIEAPDVVEHVKASFNAQLKSNVALVTRANVVVDFSQQLVSVDGTSFRISTPGEIAQELITVGGLEAWIKSRPL